MRRETGNSFMTMENKEAVRSIKLLRDKPKPARRICLPPIIGGTRIAPKPTLAQLDGESEC